MAIKIPEFENECLAYVPENYNPRLAYGVVVWLHAPGGFKQEELIERWKPLCDEHDLILLAPKSGRSRRVATDRGSFRAPRARRHSEELSRRRRRASSCTDTKVAGAMAYLVGLTNRDVVRAVAAVDAPLPRVAQLPETDPVDRLAFYTTLATKTDATPAVEAGIKRLRDMKFPVSVQEVGDQPRYLTTEELQQLVRWFDSLDRI